MPARPVSTRRALLVAVSGLAVASTVAACTAASGAPSIGGSSSSSGSGSSSSSSRTPTPAELVITPADDATGVKPSTLVSVRATTGSITKVTVTDVKGDSIAGALSDGAWKASERTRPSTTYTVKVSATGPDGTASTRQSTFTTLKPATIATYSMPYSKSTVGVGMPATIQFDSDVTSAAYRAQVEKSVSVQTTPKTEGSWGWLDNRQLMWRPKDYWKPGTKVTIKANLTGVQTGDSKWAANDLSGGFTVGSAMVSYVNLQTHQMKVTRNGKTLRTIPISAGRDQMPYITRSGTKVIMAKEPTVVMDSASIGIKKGQPGYYREVVHYAMRVTWTGEYIHSAPWSVGSQGVANVSHGCVNVGPSNAIWMYDESKVGDVVKFTGSGREFVPTEGIGVWEYSWAGWEKRSALA